MVSIGPAGDIVPILASRVEAAGPRGLRIWLRTDARFSDGSMVTFADIAQSLEEKSLEARLDNDSLVVSSGVEGVPTELQLSRAYVFRRSGGNVLGTGAFAVVEESPARILLSRVAPAPGLIGAIRMDSYATPQDAFARTLKGDADMLLEVQPRWIEFFEGVPRLQILRAPGPTANMVAFNLKRLSREERIALAGVVTSDEVRKLAFGDDCVPPVQRPESKPLPPGRPLASSGFPFTIGSSSRCVAAWGRAGARSRSPS